MDKQTTIEDFENDMAEILPDFTDNSKDGKHEWVKGDIINPARTFSRSWLMAVNMKGEEGYVKEATFTLTYDLSLQYASDNGSAAGIPTEAARIPMYRDGLLITSVKEVRVSSDILLKKVEQVMELAEKFERGFWELNRTSKGLTSLERFCF